MRKTTKKLLSSTLAGLFVLSSFPLMGAAEAEGNVALKFTPGIDGEKDAAYNESYTMHTDAAWGGVDFSFLYDASYIYVYADVKSSEKGIFNSFDLAFMATDAPKDNWGSVGTSCDVASNPFWEEGNAMDIRHWQNTMNGCEKLGFNLGWQSGNKPAESAVELVDVTPDSEYKLVATDDGAVVEFRIAYTGINEGAAISVSGDTNTAAWSKLWGGTDYTTFVLGDEYKAEVPDDTSDPVTDAPTEPATDAPTDPVTDAPTDPVTDTPTEPDTDAPVDPKPETNVIKKGTPVLDGKLDSKYLDSAVYKTLDVAKAGNIKLHGFIDPEQKKLQELVTNGALKVTGPGAYEIGENVEAFAHAETYFLWDDDALYIFSKVYDDSIFPLSEETVNNMVNNNINDMPWINDSIAHVINLDGIPLNAQGIGHLNPQGPAGGYGIFDRSGMGYSTIGTFMTAAGNENVSGTVGDGYYTVEMRIPTTDKDDAIQNLLKDGGSFSYDYWMFDTDDDAMGSWYNHKYWLHTMSAESVKYTLSDVAAEGKDPEPGDSTTTEPPVDPEIPEENIIKKGTPELDGVLDGKYLKSAVYRTIDSAKAGKSEFGGWINPSQAKRQALIVAGIMSVEDSKLTVTENSNFGVSAFAKSETYFLWDDDALYIFSTVYDEDPNAYTGETASALNNGIFDYTQWIDDNIIHRIVTKSGVADLLANAGGELLADNKINNAASYENPTLTSILGYYRNENAENVRGIVESDRYTIEMRIPFLDSVKADVLKDGAEIGYGYRIIDGDSGRLTGNTETTWLSIQNNGFDSGLTATTLVLSDEVVEDPEVTTDPTPTDTVVPPDDTETDPFVSDTKEPDVSDTKEPDVSDTKEPDVSDTKEPDVSDTKEPDVSDTDEPTPDNLGDVTGDGVVNAKDLIRLMKFIAGEDVEIVGTSDINGDKNTNAKDLVALMKLIAAAE